MSNVVRSNPGELTGRPGQTSLLTAGSSANHHTVGRLDNPQAGTFIRVVGAGTELYTGTTGALTLREGSFSGSPWSLTTTRPPLSGDSWMFIGDTAKNRKVRASDSLVLPVGLPPPGDFLTPPYAPGSLFQVTVIDLFEGVAGWTNNNGTGAGAPSNAVDTAYFRRGLDSVRFTTAAPAGSYYQFWNKAYNLNLNTVGAVPASDEDMIHFYMAIDRPDLITEVRIYFVCSPSFSTTVLPGTDATQITGYQTTTNGDAYVKSFRPSDFTAAYETTATMLSASTTANTNLQTGQQLAVIVEDKLSAEELARQYEDERAKTLEQISGRASWTEFGIVGLPLRRGDFRRIGNAPGRNWGTITGIVLYVSSASGAPTNVNIWLDYMYLQGGYGPDCSELGTTAYDYRATNYDTRTGAESNPSPVNVQPILTTIARSAILVSPNTYGDSSVRQRIYRRGGTLQNNWYFVGQNTADGATFTDTLSDLEIVAAGTLEIDNDQPVTTVNAAGTTVLAQPLSSIWGPVQDILFGCGDPYRPGHLYWTKPTEPDSWPANNNVEVCSPSEELMAGCVYAGQSFVFSRNALYAAIPNLSAPGIVTAPPTSCKHGLAARWAFVAAYGGIYFVALDGIYVTQGGPEQNISDDALRPLFNGETRYGMLPIDFAVPAALRLEVHDNELWFLYQDTGGTRRVLIYSLLYQYWRPYTFGTPISSVLSEVTSTGRNLLLGSLSASTTYTHTGVTDAGAAISASLRTGALDQGRPREDKLYGDFIIDADRAGVTLTVTPYINTEESSLAALTVTTGSGRTRYTLDPFGTSPQQARNVSFDVSWSTSVAPPTLYFFGPSYIPQPDTTVDRVIDWDHYGRPGDKWVKGITIEADTGGLDKTVIVEADGATQTTLTVNTAARRIAHFSFAQFKGRLLRLRPTDANSWKLYSWDWIFDEEPISIARWESQEVDHGIPGHHTLFLGLISLLSTAAVTLTITGTLQPGTTFSDAYTLASTSGVKRKLYVPFNARKGVLWKYLFTSTAAFTLYREESQVIVQPWGSPSPPMTVSPFGDDDLASPSRAMRSASLVAARGGGGA